MGFTSAVGIFFKSFPSTRFTPGRKSAISDTTTVEKGAFPATSATLE